jgi:hypothetical protein
MGRAASGTQVAGGIAGESNLGLGDWGCVQTVIARMTKHLEVDMYKISWLDKKGIQVRSACEV